MLDIGATHLAKQRTLFMSSPVTIQRNGETDIAINATKGVSDFSYVDEYGVDVLSQSKDYIVLASDVTFANPLPKQNDIIVEVIEGYTIESEVLSFGNEPHYRFTDSFKKEIRIHTREFKREIAP